MDTYADTTISFVDAKAAYILCTVGAEVYLMQEELGITDEWVKDHIVPNMVAAGVPAQVCLVLGCSVLWKVAKRFLDADAGHLISSEVVERMMSAFHDLGKRNELPVNMNPVNRVNICVSGIDAKTVCFRSLAMTTLVAREAPACATKKA